MPRNENRFNKKVFFFFSFVKISKLFGLPSQPKCMKRNQCVYRRQVHNLYGNGILFFTCFGNSYHLYFIARMKTQFFFFICVCLCSFAGLVSYRIQTLWHFIGLYHVHTFKHKPHFREHTKRECFFYYPASHEKLMKQHTLTQSLLRFSVSVHFATNER